MTETAEKTKAGCICQDQHRRGYCTEPGCPYANERKRLEDMDLTDLRHAYEVIQANEVLSRERERILRDELKTLRTTLEHRRQECGKLRAKIGRLSGCLIAIHQAPDIATVAALKSVAYDAALNCISEDVASFQIERRSEREITLRNEEAARQADATEA